MSKSYLQQVLKQKILHQFYSLENFNFHLDQLKSSTCQCEKYHIENIKLYFNSIFYTEVDVEADVKTYRNQTIKTLLFLQKHIDSNIENEMSIFLKSLIEFNQAHVGSLRIIHRKKAV